MHVTPRLVPGPPYQQLQESSPPPRSPKLNGGVERAHRTHTEEFYEVTESSFDLSELKDELLEWEGVYNTVRPHQALGYVTPLKFLEQWKEYSGKEDVSLII
jgi:transposase InsO family protein